MIDKYLDQIRFYDYHIYTFLHGTIHGRPFLNDFYLFFAKYGIILFFLSFIYLIDRKKINAFICSFTAAGIAIIINTLILLFWKRPRPFISHSDEIIRPITEGLRVTSFSFPSVHTYISFAIATSIYLYGHKKLGTILYVLAFLVAISRIGAGLHYPSDVIGGLILGTTSGITAYQIIRRSERNWKIEE